jgi:hypothetical protein
MFSSVIAFKIPIYADNLVPPPKKPKCLICHIDAFTNYAARLITMVYEGYLN